MKKKYFKKSKIPFLNNAYIATLIGLGLVGILLLFKILSTVLSEYPESNYFIAKNLSEPEVLAELAAKDTDAFHLFTHGRPGELLINEQWLKPTEIRAWIVEKQLLKGKTKLHIYGCNFASGLRGKTAVDFLEQSLNIKLAASSNTTGPDGDWNLEEGSAKTNIKKVPYLKNLQLSDRHYFPPSIGNYFEDDRRFHYEEIVITTPSATLIDVVVTDGAGNVQPGSPYRIRKGRPAIINYFYANAGNTGTPLPNPPISVAENQLGRVMDGNNEGLILSSTGEFFATYRANARAHATSISSKGEAARGRVFRWAGPRYYGERIGGDEPHKHFVSVMAIEDTQLRIFGYDPSINFDLGTTGTITDNTLNVDLRAGESIIYRVAENNLTSRTGYLGATIRGVGGDIVVNTGSLNHITVNSTLSNELVSRTDFGLDQIVPVSQLGREYVVVQGNGGNEENLTITATADNTEIYVNENTTPIAILNDGDFTTLSNWRDGAMYVRSSERIYVHHSLLGLGGFSRTSGLSFIAPLTCFSSNIVEEISDIGEINTTVYDNSKINIITRRGASLSITRNDVSVATGPSRVIRGNNDWVRYQIDANTTARYSFVSDGPISISTFGAFSNAGFGSFHTGFGVLPEVEILGSCPNYTLRATEPWASYQWFLNGNPIPGATNRSYTASIQGEYSLQVTNDFGCEEFNSNEIILESCPSIALRKTSVFLDNDGDGCASLGDEIEYRFRVRSSAGNEPLSNVRVNDPLLGGNLSSTPSGDDDGDNELDPGETWLYVENYSITQDDIDAGIVTNQATARGRATDGTILTDLSGTTFSDDNPTENAICQENGTIRLRKLAVYDCAANGTEFSEVGDQVTYNFSVLSRNGNISLRNVSVNDPLLGGAIAGPVTGDTDADGELDPNETWEYTATYTVTQDDIDAGQITNQATGRGRTPDGTVLTDLSGGNFSNDNPTNTNLCNQNGLLQLRKSAVYDCTANGTPASEVGDQITYNFSIRSRNANVSLQNVRINDPLLGGAIAGPVSGDTDADGELDPDETWEYMATYTLIQADIDAGEVTNQATGRGRTPDGTLLTDLSGGNFLNDNPTETILCQENGSIRLRKRAVYDCTANGTPFSEVGDLVTYNFSILSRDGNVSLQNIRINDILLGGAISGPVSGDTDADGELDVDETWEYTATYTVTQADIDAGQITNQARGRGRAPDGTALTDLSGGNFSNDNITNTNLCQENGTIRLRKRAVYDCTANGTALSEVGDEITYNFSARSINGNVSLVNVSLSDPLLGGIVSGPISGDTDGDNELDINETWEYSETYTITQADMDAGLVANQATVNSTAPDGTVLADLSGGNFADDTITNTSLCTISSLELEKTGVFNDENGDGFAQAGETLSYAFSVTNTGSVTITNLVLSDPLPGIVVSGGPIASLAPGATDSTTYTAEYTITQADVDAGVVTNQALITGEDPNGDPVDDDSDDPTTVDPDDPTDTELPDESSLELEKTGVFNDENGDGFAQAGETLSYAFSVTNTGSVTITNLVLSDPLPGIVVSGGPIASLAPGATDSTTYTAEYTITQADVDAGVVTNQALITGEDPNGDPVDDDSDDPTTVDPDDPTDTELPDESSLELEKTGVFNDENGDGFAQAGETLSYAFSVTNTGSVTITNLVLSDPLPGIVVSGGPIASLAPGATDSTTYTAEYTITQADVDAGVVTNQALITGEDPNGDPVDDDSDDPTTVDPDDPTDTELPDESSLELEKTGVFNDENGDGFAQAGETLSYAFSVTNTGSVTITNLVLSDPLPGIVVSGGPIASLAPGATDSTTYTAEYTITQADVDAGVVTNQALITGEDPNGDPVDDDSDDPTTVDPDDPTDTELPDESSLELEKTGVFNDENGDGFAQAGETLSYAFSVTNTGSVTITNLVLSDPLPGIVVSGGPIASLAPGATDSTTYTAEYTITQADVDAGVVTNQALITGEDPNGDPVDDDSDDPTTVDPDDPTDTELPDESSLELEKTGVFNDENGDGFAQAGETLSYAFSVTNTGSVTITNLVLSDPLPGIVVSGGPIASLAPGATDSTTYTAEYTITQADVDAGVVTNQALITGEDPNGDPVDDDSDDPTTVDPDDPTDTELPDESSLELEKTGVFNDENGDGFAQAGETLSYAFSVTNTGSVTITNLVLSDPLPGIVVSGGPIASLAPGATDSTTYTAEYTITQADVDAGVVTNQALITGEDPNGDPVDDDSDDPTTVDPDDPTDTELPDESSLELEKTGVFNDENGDGFAQAGETLSYAFSVTNTGSVTITNLVLSDPLPGIVVSGGPIASLAPGATDSTTYTAEYTITQADVDAGVVTNQALITGEDPNGDPVDDDSDDPTTVDPDDPTDTELPDESSLELEKTGVFNDENGDGFAQAGETLSYAFSVTNTGSVTITNLVLSDPLPGIVVSGGPIASLAPGATDSTTYTAEYTITQADVDAGVVTNQALITGEDPNGDPVDDDSDDPTTVDPDDPTDTELPDESSLELEKTGVFNDENGDGFAQAGETLSYAFSVTNTGSVTITNLVLSDPLPGIVVSGGPIASLAPGATDSTTYTAEYTITQADVDAGVVTNQALITGEDPNGDPVDDDSDDPTTVDPDDPTDTELPDESSLELEKTGVFNDENGDGFAQAGETLSYAFSVTNTGSVTITNLVLSDPLPGIVVSGGPIASLAPGATDSTTYTAEYTITQADVDAGVVTNQALITGEDPNGDPVDDDSDDPTTVDPDDPTDTELPDESSLELEKTGVFNDENGDGFAQAGETLSYAFSVTNTGSVTITNLVLSDPLPGIVVSGGPIASLAPGATDSTTYTAEYTITQADVDAGVVTNQALITGEDPNGDPVDDDSDDPTTVDPDDPTDTELPDESSLELEKTGVFNDENGDGFAQAGETLSYAFSVTNTGSVTITNLVLSDPLPGIVVSGGPIASLAPGATDSTTYTAEYTITQADVDAGVVTNQALITGEDPNGDPVDDDSDDPTTVDPDDPTVTELPEEFEIFNGITPDGDGMNDYFEIRGISNFPNNIMRIYNRWGVLVYETNSYGQGNNIFRGLSDGRTTIQRERELPAGTYFYVLTFNGQPIPNGKSTYKGYLFINK